MTRPVNLDLQPPNLLRVQVVDGLGKPVPGVHWGVYGWRGIRTTLAYGNTKKHGRMSWASAPADAVAIMFTHTAYKSRWATLAAAKQEHVVTLEAKDAD